MSWELKQSSVMNYGNMTVVSIQKNAGEVLPRTSPSGPRVLAPRSHFAHRGCMPHYPQVNSACNPQSDLRRLLLVIFPIPRLDAEFIIGLDRDADVVTQHFAK
jgi:hypothetical protein